jgi:hypothetical protein
MGKITSKNRDIFVVSDRHKCTSYKNLEEPCRINRKANAPHHTHTAHIQTVEKSKIKGKP